jgi:hypothetical protein
LNGDYRHSNSENPISKNTFKSHQKIISLATKELKSIILLVTMMKCLRFSDMNMGNFTLVDKYLELDDKKKPGFFMATFSIPQYIMLNGLPRWVVWAMTI